MAKLVPIAIWAMMYIASTLQGSEPASIIGQFVWQGERPTEEVGSRITIDQQSNGVSGVFVYASSGVRDEGKGTGKTIAVNLSTKRGFEPRLVTATPWDTIAVNVIDRGAPTTIAFSGQGRTPPQTKAGEYLIDFAEASLRPQILYCAVNRDAFCYVLVLKHRLVSITDTNGRFSLPSVPNGRLTLRAWHENAGYIRAWNGGKDRELVVDVTQGESIELDPLAIDSSMIKQVHRVEIIE